MVVSRWADIGGQVLEGDFAGLEFRVAGELSGDPQIFEDVLTGKDIHKQTASIIFTKPTSEVTKDERQDAKPFTFAPIYGGKGMSYAPHIRRYFDKFFDVYEGMRSWHKKLLNTAVSTNIIRIPSGREYAFPNARRNPWGGVTGQTQIVNYPVQGFATGDIVPCAVIAIWKRFRKDGLKSVLINTVHDSVVADVFPGEEEQVKQIFVEEMPNVHRELQRRYSYTMKMPLATEIKIGPNWMTGKVIHG